MRPLPVKLLLTGLLAAALLAVVSCAPRPSASRSLPRNGAEDSPGRFYTLRQQWYGSPAGLTVVMNAQRTAWLPSADASISVSLDIAAREGNPMVQSHPLWVLEAVLPSGERRVVADSASSWAAGTENGGTAAFGSSAIVGGLLAPLPAEAVSLLLTLHLGPTPAEAKSGVQLRCPVERLPVVEALERNYPRGRSGGF